METPNRLILEFRYFFVPMMRVPQTAVALTGSKFNGNFLKRKEIYAEFTTAGYFAFFFSKN